MDQTQPAGTSKDLIYRFKNLPKRKLSEIEKQMIFILIEKSKLQRETMHAILDKGFLIFLTFLVLAYLFKMTALVPDIYITILFALGIIVLVVSIVSFEAVTTKEDKVLQELLDSFLR